MYEDYPVDGSVGDVETWVGTDPERARYALDIETAEGGKNRSTLTPWLAEVAASAEEAPPADGASAATTQPDSGYERTEQPEATPRTEWDDAHAVATAERDPDEAAAEAANRDRAADHLTEAAEADAELGDLDEADRRIGQRAKAAADVGAGAAPADANA